MMKELEILENPRVREYYADMDVKSVNIHEDIISLPEYIFGECRNLISVTFPKSLVKIGRSAFYNCRKLKKAVINGNISDVADGAFRNCESLDEIVLKNVDEEDCCLKNIIPELEQPIFITLEMIDGEKAKLFLPRTIYAFEANEPARTFMQEDYGSGVYYRQCVNLSKIDFAKYDSVFEVAKNEESIKTVMKISFARLMFPYRLADKDKERYINYIKTNIKKIFEIIILSEDEEKLDFLLGLKEIDEKDVKVGIELAQRFERPRMALKILSFAGKSGSGEEIMEL
ncbi:MAG: leucine-rich repeat domain-containing protein [Lachnospiraceae bacterium]|nr:leucine-rich repeat domain-containing protein [Lachnospiraceae bacterium]